MEQQGVVAERRIDVLVDVDPVGSHATVVVADSEAALDSCARGPVEVQGAENLAVDVEVAVAAGVVPLGRLVEVRPLREPVLAPELGIAVVEGGGDYVIVTELMLGRGVAVQLRLLRPGRRLLVDRIAVGRQVKAVHRPATERAASVGGLDIRTVRR